MSEFPTYWISSKLTGFKDIFQMFGNGAAPFFKQHSEQFLRQPDSFILNAHLDAVFTGLFGEDQEFGSAVADLQFFSLFMLMTFFDEVLMWYYFMSSSNNAQAA